MSTQTQDAKELHDSALALPHKKPVALFVLQAASNFSILDMFSGEVYKNEVLRKEVSSVSRISRDTDASFHRRLSELKDDFGIIDDIPIESRLHRDDVIKAVLLIALASIMGIILYAQYDERFGASIAAAWNKYEWTILGFAIVFLFVVGYLYLRRRSRK